MAKTYEQLQRQIDSLQSEADKLRSKELDGVIARIREAIAFYQLSESDLDFTGRGSSGRGRQKAVAAAPKARRGAARKIAKSPKAAVAYSNGAGGTWGGRGKRPQWLRDALAAGRTLDEFRAKAG